MNKIWMWSREKYCKESMAKYWTVAYGEAGSLNYTSISVCVCVNCIGNQNFQ
jgi:hypothetical protein